MDKHINIQKVNLARLTFPPKHHFFGFYDLCPWDISGRRILVMETDFINRIPEKNDVAQICIVDLENKNFEILNETMAWNWQQGCRLQWLPPDYDKYVVYNDRVEDRFVSVILDIQTKEKKILPLPVFSIHPSGNYAVTLNFSRLHSTFRGYGYAGIEDKYFNEIAPKNDGIYLLNLNNGENRLIIPLAQLYRHKYSNLMKDGKHWVSHLSFNPIGTRFILLHRFQLKDGGIYTRLFTASVDGSDIRLLLDSGGASHFDWKNDEEILIWARLPNKINQIRKNRWIVKNILKYIMPFYHSFISNKSFVRTKIVNDYYLAINNKTGEIKKIGEGILKEDGHCSVSPDERWLLTDTYPDKNHYRTLILYNYKKNTRIDIGKFYSLPDKKYRVNDDWDISSMRCDLHPRWSRDGTQVCIDSVHEGTRQMYLLDIKEIVRPFLI